MNAVSIEQIEQYPEQVSPPRCKGAVGLQLWLARMIGGKQLLPADAVFFLLVEPIEAEAEKAFMDSDELAFIHEEIERVEKKYGIRPEDGGWEDSALAPPERRRLEDDHRKLYRRFIVDAFNKHGEPDLADLFERETAQYEARREKGRVFFFGNG